MVVDIIDLESEEYKNLSSVQLAMVYSAQTEKNEILAKAAKQKVERLNRLLKQNMARSSLREDSETDTDADAQVKIDVIKEDLLYRLTYSDPNGNEKGKYRYPENPNYDLSYEQRFLVVRDYYMHLTKNAQWRLVLFGNDIFAVEYLGEYYQTLYDLFAYYAK